ncbi:hypothetical protein PLEOSDRAFT_1106108 [Pleurotus ostreatus PC15]|uniref:Uncharacterized protein n=1 Tax=Pleurotus ostreatus (strain PC15) TaxID=1137138 RepID=A0A067NAU0_PLEO1|nr:hypothetical protein PLEOSDRAFT_1106108 [Pleurotus ostreatus PC15]
MAPGRADQQHPPSTTSTYASKMADTEKRCEDTPPTVDELLEGDKVDVLSALLGEDMRMDRVTVDWLGDLIPVSVFVASVQAQILSFTITLEQPGRESIVVAANWFGFNGLVLDIVSGVLAAIRVISLKRYSRAAQCSIDLMKWNYAALRKLLGDVDSFARTPWHHKLISDHKQLIQEVEAMSPYRLTPVERVGRGDSDDQRGPQGVLQWTEPNDLLALYTLSLGVTFLLLSVILQAVATQFRRVWVGCVFFFILGYVYVLLPNVLRFSESSPGLKNVYLGGIQRPSKLVHTQIYKASMNMDKQGLARGSTADSNGKSTSAPRSPGPAGSQQV